MNSLPLNKRSITIDVSDPVEEVPPAEDGAVTEGGEPAASVEMPEDFAFAMWLNNHRVGEFPLTEITEGAEVHTQGDFVTIVNGGDAIAGANGFGLKVTKNEAGELIWTPAPVALYRDTQLVGVFNPETGTVSAGDMTVPKELVIPEPAAAAAQGDAFEDNGEAPAAVVVEEPKKTEPKKDPVKEEPKKKDPPKAADDGWGF
jgi:hypothetical protein